MAYLIDASSLIEAKDRYYGMDFCPGFWDWLDQHHASGQLLSIAGIGDELAAGTDALATWAKARKASFFVPLDAATLAAVPAISAWVQGTGYKQHAIDEFFRGADSLLIAYAQVYGHTVVSDEIFIPGERKKVKIPAVCSQSLIPCISPFDMLRAANVRLII